MIRGILLLLLGAGVACTTVRRDPPRVDAATTTPATTDSMAGRAVIVGSEPATMVALQPSLGSMMTLDGSADALRNVSGADVTVFGRKTPGRFDVKWFVVRRVNGRDVDDGTVVLSGDRVLLEEPSGKRREIPNAPPSLRGMAGARIWVTRPEPGMAPSFGRIAP